VRGIEDVELIADESDIAEGEALENGDIGVVSECRRRHQGGRAAGNEERAR